MNYPDLTEYLQRLEENTDSLFLGDSLTLAELKNHESHVEKLHTHEEKITVDIPDLWQKADLMYFPNSKAARLFLAALSEEELAIVAQKKVIVMGQKTKAVFDNYQLVVIQTTEPTFDQVVEKIKEEMKR